jgi:hypothetical protein
VRDTGERQQVVLAQRVERDVACEDELVVALVVRERGQAERPRCEQLGVRGGDPARCVARVLVDLARAECDQQVADGALSGVEVDREAAADRMQLRRCRRVVRGH